MRYLATGGGSGVIYFFVGVELGDCQEDALPLVPKAMGYVTGSEEERYRIKHNSHFSIFTWSQEAEIWFY